MCKKPSCDAIQKGTRDTTGLLYFDGSKIILIFWLQSVARLLQGQRLVRLEKKMRNVVSESGINVWLIWDSWSICDSPKIHLHSIYNPSCDLSVTHLRPICSNVVTHMWLFCYPSITNSTSDPCATYLWIICDLSETHSWPISISSGDSYVTNL